MGQGTVGKCLEDAVKFWLRSYGLHTISKVSSIQGSGRGLGQSASYSWAHDSGRMVSTRTNVWPFYGYATRRKMG